MRVRVEERPRARSVVEGRFAGTLDRIGRRDLHERTVEWAAGERRANNLIGPRGEEQRHRGRSFAKIGAGDLAGLLRLARAVEDVIGDLECDAETRAVLAEPLVAAGAEQAGRLDQLP